jgi:hypothetical protein
MFTSSVSSAAWLGLTFWGMLISYNDVWWGTLPLLCRKQSSIRLCLVTLCDRAAPYFPSSVSPAAWLRAKVRGVLTTCGGYIATLPLLCRRPSSIWLRLVMHYLRGQHRIYFQRLPNLDELRLGERCLGPMRGSCRNS